MNRLDLLTFPLTGRSLIEASAGTGKTYTIAALYLRAIIEHQYQPQQILVVTFTKAATQELRERIRSLIKDALNFLRYQTDKQYDPVVQQILEKYPKDNWDEIKQHLNDCLVTMDESAIFTIHGFVHRVLSESAFETGNVFEMQLVDSDDDLLEIACNDFWRLCITRMGSTELEILDAVFSSPYWIKKDLRQLLRSKDIKLIPNQESSQITTDDYIHIYKQAKDLWLDSYEEIISLILEATEKKYLHGGSYKEYLINNAIELINGFFVASGVNINVSDKTKYFCQNHIVSKKKKGLDDKIPYHRFFELWEQIFETSKPLSIQFKLKVLKDAVAYCGNRLMQLKLRNKVMAHDDVLDLLDQALQSQFGSKLSASIRQKYPLAMIDEFQDTDNIQYQIFSMIYPDNSNLIMIGDPKQAIYSFRGGDIFTYLQAQQETNATNRFTLDTNWRSTSGLIKAVNSIFSNKEEPFIYSGIEFVDVKASGKHDDFQFAINSKVVEPLTIWHIPVTEENQGYSPKGYIKKDIAKELVAYSTAGEVVRLLEPKTKAMVDGRLVNPTDITVLVRNAKQAYLIIEALRSRGISCAYQGNDSVFAANQALELNTILHALAFPENESYLLSSLATGLIGKTSSQILLMQQDEKGWDELSRQVIRLHQQWHKGHFIQTIYQFLHLMDIPANCLQQENGERALTNLLHLIELLQQATKTTHGINGLLAWYKQQLGDETVVEEKQLRLESDSDLINVVTIHKSKGLEYSIVFAPFLWDVSPNRSSTAKFHDIDTDGIATTVIDFGSDELKEHKELATKEELSEEIRLMYVALTRAKHKCYISWGKIAYIEKSPIGFLLDRDSEIKNLDDDQICENLSRLVAKSDNTIELIKLPEYSERVKQRADVEVKLSAMEFTGGIEDYYRISSFTSLSSTVEHNHDVGVYGSESSQIQYQELARELVEEHKEISGEQLTIFDFPKGARAGVFFHHILENIDFQDADSEHSDQLIEKSLRKFGFDQQWYEIVKNNILAVIDCSLGDSNVSLSKIAGTNRVNEMEFMLSHGRVSNSQINFILNKYEKYNRIDRPLEFGQIEGLLKGFIDLTFEYQGKYYIVDYKTNYLGNDYSFYNVEGLQESIIDHDYDLQYIIYSAALHRYLTEILPEYTYKDNFGGVYYLYLRGISEYGEGGVYYDKPPQKLLEEIFI